jgi:hypothetical protein
MVRKSIELMVSISQEQIGICTSRQSIHDFANAWDPLSFPFIALRVDFILKSEPAGAMEGS